MSIFIAYKKPKACCYCRRLFVSCLHSQFSKHPQTFLNTRGRHSLSSCWDLFLPKLNFHACCLNGTVLWMADAAHPSPAGTLRQSASCPPGWGGRFSPTSSAVALLPCLLHSPLDSSLQLLGPQLALPVSQLNIGCC